MSLDYDISDVKDWDTFCLDKEGELKPLTERIVFGTLSIDIGTITEETGDEGFRRHYIASVVYGDDHLTMEELVSHIGLRTNVFDTTRTAFKHRMFRVLNRRAGIKARREKEETR